MLGLLILGSAISAGAVTVPNGLPRHFGIGLAAQPDNDGLYGWMPQTGIPWDYAYQYLCGGANTCNGCGWATWNDNGQFVTYYCQGADQHGYIPTFSYYQVLQSTGPCDGCAENNRDLANLNSCSFIATQDLGRLYDERRFEVLGRFDDSDIRGCNLMAG